MKVTQTYEHSNITYNTQTQNYEEPTTFYNYLYVRISSLFLCQDTSNVIRIPSIALFLLLSSLQGLETSGIFVNVFVFPGLVPF